MAKPPPDNLGNRQHDLNKRVNDAFAKQINFDNVKEEKETTAVDKFFKIDLAAKCRNINYIIDILKEGNTLYCHRALKKCKWIHDDEYSYIVDPLFLEDNIFSETSMRVKRLILKTVAMNLRKDDRAVVFYNYCMDNRLTDIALKCLLFTSEEFKLGLMRNKNLPINDILRKKFTYAQFIIDKSFTLLEAYIAMLPSDHEKMILKFKYMYPVDNMKYLDLLENYSRSDEEYSSNVGRIQGTCLWNKDMSEHIMRKYKNRVLAKPIFYLNRINRTLMIQYLTADDARFLIFFLLPSTAEGFWNNFLHGECKSLLDLIPHDEKFQLIKSIFNKKYPNEEFETHVSFYSDDYHEFLTVEQREEWALNQIKREKQILGVGNDYLWYRFINFIDAFEEIKKYIMVTKEPVKRGEMINTLVKSVRNNRELETLFQYYSKRHINEAIPEKASFFDTVIFYQNVFEFDEFCWEAFYTILLSLEIYNPPKTTKDLIPDKLTKYKNVVLVYHILHGKEMPEGLKDFLLNDFFPYDNNNGDSSIEPLLAKLNTEQNQQLFRYLHTFSSDQINDFKNKPYTREGKSMASRHFKIILKLIKLFNVNPHVYKYIPSRNHSRKSRRSTYPNVSDRQLLLDLKNDKTIVIAKLDNIRSHLRTYGHRTLEIKNFLKKIKIYFPNDITNSFLELFNEFVNVNFEGAVDDCVYALFELGDETAILDLMEKFLPKNHKIDYQEDYKELSIRKAICRHACNSVPPVPLENVLAYMKGDYARFCLHLFGVYIAALPVSSCVKLVQSVLDSPVSIQKHAIRLAILCFSADKLNNVIGEIWKKTKNVSLRSVIYKAIFNRIADKNEIELHDLLISFTTDLRDDDQKVIFSLVKSSTLPKDILAEYIKATWKAIGQFKDKEPNISRKKQVIKVILSNFSIMDKEFVRTIIDEHLTTMFVEDKIEVYFSKEDIAGLYLEKWDLTVKYILACSCDGPASYVHLAQDIVGNCLKKWNETRSGSYVYQYCCWEFIKNLHDKSIEYLLDFEKLIPIYEGILDVIEANLPLQEIYLSKWEIQLVMSSSQIVKNYGPLSENCNRDEIIREFATEFGKDVGKLISVYVSKNIYFTSLSDKIKDLIVQRVEKMLKVIFSSTGGENSGFINCALTSVAAALIEFKTMETSLLAVHVLPSEIAEWEDDYTLEKYQFVLDAIQNCSYIELQCYAKQKLYKPFVRSAPKPKRKIIVPTSAVRQRYIQARLSRRRGRGRR